MTEAGLEALLVRWIEQWGGTEASARAMLSRAIRRAEAPELSAAIPSLVERYRSAGLLDDARWAAGRARRLRRTGSSARAVRAHLQAKGVARSIVDTLVQGDQAPHDDLAAAIALVRRRRMGWHRAPEAREEHRARDLAALGRAGFSYDIAKQALAGPIDGPEP